MTSAQPEGKDEKQAIVDRQTFPFLMIPKAFFSRIKPTSKEICVYVALKNYTLNRKGTCEYVSIRTMADLVDLSESSFKRGMAGLVKKGAVKIRHRSRKSSRGERIPLPSMYEIVNLEAGQGGGF